MTNKSKNFACIYIITNPKFKVYIGQTVNFNKRYNAYKNAITSIKSQGKIYSSIIKYGFNEHKVDILRKFNNNCKITLNYWESYYIKMFKSNQRDFGLNLTSGGSSFEMSIETKKKLSDLIKNSPERIQQSVKNINIMHQKVASGEIPHPMKGKTHSEESINKILNTKRSRFYPKYVKVVSEVTKEKLRQINLGKKQSEATKQKKREIALRSGHKPPIRVWTDEERAKLSKSVIGSKNPNYGKGMKPHVKEALLKVNLGVKRTDEFKLKQSLARKGKPKSEEWKAANRKPKTKYFKNGVDILKKDLINK